MKKAFLDLLKSLSEDLCLEKLTVYAELALIVEGKTSAPAPVNFELSYHGGKVFLTLEKQYYKEVTEKLRPLRGAVKSQNFKDAIKALSALINASHDGTLSAHCSFEKEEIFLSFTKREEPQLQLNFTKREEPQLKLGGWKGIYWTPEALGVAITISENEEAWLFLKETNKPFLVVDLYKRLSTYSKFTYYLPTLETQTFFETTVGISKPSEVQALFKDARSLRYAMRQIGKQGEKLLTELRIPELFGTISTSENPSLREKLNRALVELYEKESIVSFEKEKGQKVELEAREEKIFIKLISSEGKLEAEWSVDEAGNVKREKGGVSEKELEKAIKEESLFTLPAIIRMKKEREKALKELLKPFLKP